jgi:hypothetical protein
MPTFNFSPNELQILVRFFMAMSGQQDPYIKEPMEPLTDQEKLTARQMFTFRYSVFEVSRDRRSNTRRKGNCTKLPACRANV